jgi:hypothetical protein
MVQFGVERSKTARRPGRQQNTLLILARFDTAWCTVFNSPFNSLDGVLSDQAKPC